MLIINSIAPVIIIPTIIKDISVDLVVIIRENYNLPP